VCISMGGNDMQLEVLSKDGVSSSASLSAILGVVALWSKEHLMQQVTVTITPNETLDTVHVSPSFLFNDQNGLCMRPNVTIAFHKASLPGALVSNLVVSKATIYFDLCSLDFPCILTHAGKYERSRKPLKLEFGGVPGLPQLEMNGHLKQLPYPSVEMLIDCIEKDGLESLLFKGSLPLCEDDSEKGMVGLLKAAQSKGTRVTCEELQAHHQHAWNKARVDCGIVFQEEHAKLKVDEEERLRQSQHDEDNRSLEGKVRSFALRDLDCYLAGLTFFGPLLPYRSMKIRRRLKATHGRVALSPQPCAVDRQGSLEDEAKSNNSWTCRNCNTYQCTND
jgi:hypothetical protein